MKSPHASTWNLRRAVADLDSRTEGSDTDLLVKIESPGYSSDPEAINLSIEVRHGPGRNPDDEPVRKHFDLRAPDFRPLLFILEAVISEAERAGILDDGHVARTPEAV